MTTPKEYQAMQGGGCPYKKCDGSGFLPVKKKDGSIDPHARVYCECREAENERKHYAPLKPEDFDFPMSYSFYRGLCREYGWPDTGPLEPLPKPEQPLTVFKPRPVDKEIDQLKAQFLYVDRRLNEHLDKGKKRDRL